MIKIVTGITEPGRGVASFWQAFLANYGTRLDFAFAAFGIEWV